MNKPTIMKRICYYLTTMCFVFSIISAKAYVVSGRLYDNIDKEWLIGANIEVLEDSSTTVVNRALSDDKGRFSIEIPEAKSIILSFSYLGYENKRICISGESGDIKLGNINMTHSQSQLGEVTIYADDVIEKYDKYIVTPTVEEKNNATGVTNLLGNIRMKLPGMDVDELARRITINGKEPVFQINGKVEPLSKIRMLDKNRILRIEYQNQADIRFSGTSSNSGVINFILDKNYYGGSLYARTGITVTTPRTNAEIGLTYSNKKSEWSFNYDNVWRKSSKQYTYNREEYIGTDYIIERSQTGLPSDFKDFDNQFSLGYTYMHDKNTMFSADLRLRHHKVDAVDNYVMEEIKGSEVNSYGKVNNRNSKAINPVLNLYLNKQIGVQSVEFNLTAANSSGDYTRGINYTYDTGSQYTQTNVTDNESYMLEAEGVYTRRLKHFTVRTGLKYSYNTVDNGYSEGNGSTNDHLSKHNTYLYGNIGGNIKRFGYSAGIGLKGESVKSENQSITNFRPNIIVSTKYQLSRKSTIGLDYNYIPSMPPLFNYSEIIQSVDDISYRTGNANIKPDESHILKLSSRTLLGKVAISISGEYTRTNNPLVNDWVYVSDESSKYYDRFINITTNGDYNERLRFQLDIASQRVLNYFALFCQIGWDGYRLSWNHENNTLNHVYASAGVNANYKSFNFIAKYDILPRYSVYNLEISKMYGNAYLGVNWRYKRIVVGITGGYLFTDKPNRMKKTYVSSVRPAEQEYYIKDFSNMVEISFQYNLDFGKRFNKSRKSISDGKIDTGVNISY